MSLSRESLIRSSHPGESIDTTEITHREEVVSRARGWPVLVYARTIVSGFLQRSSFVLAIILPFVYLPILVSGLPTADYLAVLGGLISLHIVCLLVGHDYPPRPSPGTSRE